MERWKSKWTRKIFARRLKEGGKYVPVKSIDNLYNTEKNNKISKTPKKSNIDMKNKLTANKSYNEIWTRKYKRLNNIKENEEKKNDENNKENNINNNRLLNQKKLYIYY